MATVGDGNNGEKLYFAYGSNLFSRQMHRRCPNSVPVGLAHLSGWTWLINERGYANIESDTTQTKESEEKAHTDGVYGVLYLLDAQDETILDKYEGVPSAYQKRFVDVILASDFLAPASQVVGHAEHRHQKKKGDTVRVLAYIDHKRILPAEPNFEYIDRMNDGIDEATKEWGLPQAYVDVIMRPFIPTDEFSV
ncbi:hypothetical protein M426DRAFT_68888 [Hypoxylon sp. CI-4A]|nr:hypothetical protein M426DRAFT_68888 [Hypoxylon sp. CI-4A]